MRHRALAAAALLLVWAGCPSKTQPPGGNDSGPGGPVVVAGTVSDYLGNPVADATLSSGGASTTSASDGTYTLSGIPTPDGGAVVVLVNGSGYLESAYSVALPPGASGELDPVLMPMSASQPLDATHGGLVQGLRGARLTAGPGAFVDGSGNPVTGTVQVALTPLTPGVPGLVNAYPGNMAAVDGSGNPVSLETHGVMDVTVTQNGQKLQIASGQTVAVQIPAATVGTLPSGSSLWSFDLATALWKYEGTATLAGATYTAQLPHLSIWNVDCSTQGTPVVCLRGDLVTCDHQSIIGAQITVTANDDSYGTQTEGTGQFCVALPPGGGSDAGASSDASRCAQNVSASSWDIRVQGKGLDFTVTVQAPTQGTNDGQNAAGCSEMEFAGQCINLHNIGCVGDGGLLVLLDGGTSCSYWPTDAGPDAGRGDAGLLDPFAATCAAPLATLFSCFNGSGGCTFDGNLDAGQITYSYGNGSKEMVHFGGNSSSIGYYAPDGGMCGSANTFGNGIDFVIGTSVYDLTAQGSVTTITCPDGGTLTLDDDQTSAAVGCASNLGGSGGACKPTKGPGTPCLGNADCGGPEGTICCQDITLGSICLPPPECGLYWDAGCTTTFPCLSPTDNFCCTSLESQIGFDLCLPESACSSCGPANPCPSGQSCCSLAGTGSSLCIQGNDCPSQCTSSAQCGSGQLCCPQPDSSTESCEPTSGGACPPGACQSNTDCPSTPQVQEGCCFISSTVQYGSCTPLQNGSLPSYCQ